MWSLKAKDIKMNLKYISVDICTDFHQLPKLVESFFLDEGYHYVTWSEKLNKTIRLSTIIALYADVPSGMMDFLKAVFAKDPRFTGEYTSFDAPIGKEQFEVYTSILHFIVQRLKWGHLLILSIQPSFMTPLYQMLAHKAKESKLCVHFKEIDGYWSMNNESFFTRDWFRENKPAVITVGDEYGQVEIIKRLAKFMEENNMTIPILAEGFMTGLMQARKAPSNLHCFKDLSSSFLVTELSAFTYMKLILWPKDLQMIKDISDLVNKSMSPSQQFALMKSLWLSDVFVNGGRKWSCNCSLDYQCVDKEIKRSMEEFNFVWDYAFKTTNDQYLSSIFLLDPNLPFSQTRFENYRKGGWNCREHIHLVQEYKDVLSGKVSENPYGKNRPSLTDVPHVKTSQCPVLSCQPGFYKSYQKVEHGFSWICIPCPENHFKADAGNHECTPCKGRLSIDNGKRTACVDPYTNVSIDYSTKEFYITGSVSLLGLFIVMATLITFIINRNTPIVMTSDFKISVFHLCVHSLTLLSTPLTFFTNEICIIKPLIFSTLYTLNIGIVFIKSQKLLQAFLSKVRITPEEAKRTVIGQFFTVIVFLLSANNVLFICHYQQPVKVLEFEIPTDLTRENVCNTYFHNTVVMIAIAVIQLMCAIQAFRGRNLPNVMNDGVILMYVTFILTASFAVCFITVPFQKPIRKEI